jgi:hypothetical protein
MSAHFTIFCMQRVEDCDLVAQYQHAFPVALRIARKQADHRAFTCVRCVSYPRPPFTKHALYRAKLVISKLIDLVTQRPLEFRNLFEGCDIEVDCAAKVLNHRRAKTTRARHFKFSHHADGTIYLAPTMPSHWCLRKRGVNSWPGTGSVFVLRHSSKESRVQ